MLTPSGNFLYKNIHFLSHSTWYTLGISKKKEKEISFFSVFHTFAREQNTFLQYG